MIEIVLRQQTDVIPAFEVQVNGHKAGHVVRHAERKNRWYRLGGDTVFTSKEAAACLIASRYFESEARERAKEGGD